MTRQRITVNVPPANVTIEALVESTHPTVLLVPSANRDATDFDDLARRLTAAGYGSVSINLRGIGASTGPTEDLTLQDLAGDITAVVTTVIQRPAHLVGHAFGNTVVRATAAYHPSTVASVTLLACGGHNKSDPPDVEWLKHSG